MQLNTQHPRYTAVELAVVQSGGALLLTHHSLSLILLSHPPTPALPASSCTGGGAQHGDRDGHREESGGGGGARVTVVGFVATSQAARFETMQCGLLTGCAPVCFGWDAGEMVREGALGQTLAHW